MKKILFCLLLAQLCFAQKSKIDKTIVFPGCEEKQTNEELNACFSQGFNYYISQLMADFDNIADYYHVNEANLKLDFVIDTNGKFKNFKAVESNSILLEEYILKTLETINEDFENVGLKIEPATQEGKPLNLSFQLPVNYTSGQIKKEIKTFPADEFVLFTFTNEDKTYELRKNKSDQIKSYEKTAGGYKFYKDHKALEWMTDDTFSSSILFAVTTGSRLIITQGVIDSTPYRVELKNFLNIRSRNPYTIEVYKLNEKNEMVDVFIYNTKSDFINSPYANLIYR